ncbi:MAG TPA: cytochrome c peroxidase, partial [Blastocatellia bacterium]|nr:cytochrome c peroxidase [Blastocatellia bacterium]
MRSLKSQIRVCTLLVFGCACLWVSLAPRGVRGDDAVDQELKSVLASYGFTGRIESTVEARLGRPINQKLAAAGHLLYFDAILAIKQDNACAACHSPTTGFADTQSIAIGIDSNGSVGPS